RSQVAQVLVRSGVRSQVAQVLVLGVVSAGAQMAATCIFPTTISLSWDWSRARSAEDHRSVRSGVRSQVAQVLVLGVVSAGAQMATGDFSTRFSPSWDCRRARSAGRIIEQRRSPHEPRGNGCDLYFRDDNQS